MSGAARGMDEVVAALAAGGVVLLPTDTLPGLHARLDRPDAVARLRRLKRRDAARPLLLLCAGIESALSLARGLEPRAVAFARRCWPGPFTLVVPVDDAVSAVVHPGGTTAGLRVPRPRELRTLLERVGSPLVSTSANRSGEPPATTLAEAAARLRQEVDLVASLPWQGAGGPSSVVDLTAWPPRELRPGIEELPEF